MNTAEEALNQLNKRARQSKKFQALVLGTVVTAGIGVVSVWWKADAALVGVILGNLSLLIGGYVGSTAWQDRAVRMAAVQTGQAQHAGLK